MFKHKIKAKYDIVAKSLGILTKAELKEQMPELYKAYESVYGADRPDVRLEVSDTFHFPPERYSMGSWHQVFLWRSGKVEHVGDLDKYYGTKHKLASNDMVLDCMVGNFNFCRLYLHQDNANKLIPKADLTDDEKTMLKTFVGLKPFARKGGYYDKKYGYMEGRDAQSKHPAEYDDVVNQLIKKNLIKMSASGASQLTKAGKSIAVSL